MKNAEKFKFKSWTEKRVHACMGTCSRLKEKLGKLAGFCQRSLEIKEGKFEFSTEKNNSCLFWHFFNDFRSLFQRRFFVSCENIESKKNLNSNNEKVEKEKRAIANTWIVTRWRVRANYKSGRLVLTHFFPRQNWKLNIF